MTPTEFNRLFVEAFHREDRKWLDYGRGSPIDKYPSRAQCHRCGCWLKIGEVKLCDSCKAIVGEKA